MKSIVPYLTSLCLVSSLYAQDWESLRVGDAEYKFPQPFKEFNAANGDGVVFTGDDVALFVTSLPDTSEISPGTQLERSRYYAATAAAVTLKLGGKMTANRDTMIADHHLYYTALEVPMSDSAVSVYELLQYMHADTLHAFSAQYVVGDKSGTSIRDDFFKSIRLPGMKEGKYVLPAILTGAVVVFVVALITLRRRLSFD